MLILFVIFSIQKGGDRLTEGERIRYLRKEVLHLTLEKFGARLGVRKSVLSTIENGKSGVTDQMRLAICNAYDVSEEWLRTGTGPMIEPVDADDELAAQIAKLFHYRPESFRRRLFNMLDAMPDELLDRLEAYAVKYLLPAAENDIKKADGNEFPPASEGIEPPSVSEDTTNN